MSTTNLGCATYQAPMWEKEHGKPKKPSLICTKTWLLVCDAKNYPTVQNRCFRKSEICQAVQRSGFCAMRPYLHAEFAGSQYFDLVIQKPAKLEIKAYCTYLRHRKFLNLLIFQWNAWTNIWISENVRDKKTNRKPFLSRKSVRERQLDNHVLPGLHFIGVWQIVNKAQ